MAPEEGELTCGYYVVDRGIWKDFARPGEKCVCDHCMWDDPKYQAIYGNVTRTP